MSILKLYQGSRTKNELDTPDQRRGILSPSVLHKEVYTQHCDGNGPVYYLTTWCVGWGVIGMEFFAISGASEHLSHYCGCKLFHGCCLFWSLVWTCCPSIYLFLLLDPVLFSHICNWTLLFSSTFTLGDSSTQPLPHTWDTSSATAPMSSSLQLRFHLSS